MGGMDMLITVTFEAIQSADIPFIQDEDRFTVPEILWVSGIIAVAGHIANGSENHALMKRI